MEPPKPVHILEKMLIRCEAEIDRLSAAIRKHRDAKGHDRCWENDRELYLALSDTVASDLDPKLPPECEFRQRCKEYYFQQLSAKGKPVPPTDDKPWWTDKESKP